MLLIAIQLPLGVFMVKYGARTNFAAPTGQMYDTHKLIGMLILLFVIARFAYRMLNGAPGDEPTLEPWQRHRQPHHALGDLCAVVHRAAARLAGDIGLWAVQAVRDSAAGAARREPGPRDAALLAAQGAAILLVLLVGMHVGAALFHYVIRKDGVLNRMWPGLPRRDGKDGV